MVRCRGGIRITLIGVPLTVALVGVGTVTAGAHGDLLAVVLEPDDGGVGRGRLER